MKNLFIAIASLLIFTSCDKDKSLSKKIPGWYTVEKKMEPNGTISGKLTYYKNGALKIKATIKEENSGNIKTSLELTAKGTWKVENGYLKENITEIITVPQSLGDALLDSYKKDHANEIGDKIVHVNKQELQVQNSKGEINTYKRVENDN
jgi:hypothetical protein